MRSSKILFVIVGWLSTNIAYTQLLWNKSIDFSYEANYASTVSEFENDQYIIGTMTYPSGVPQGALISLDKFGNVRWDKSIDFGENHFTLLRSFKILNDEIWSTGVLRLDTLVNFYPAIVANNTNGDELWRKVYDFKPFNINFARGDIRMYNDTTVLVFFNGYKFENGTRYIHKQGYMLLDTLGNEILRHWWTSDFDISDPTDIVPFPGGGYMMSVIEIQAGQGIPFEYRLTIRRLDDTFGILWNKVLPYEEAAAGRFSFDEKKNIYMTWSEDPTNPNSGSPWGSPAIISYDSNGLFRWKYIFDDNPRLRLLGHIITTSQGNIISCGVDEPGFHPIQWGWMVSLDTNGNLLWDHKYTIDGISPDIGGGFNDLIETKDNHLLVVGGIQDKYPLESFEARQNIWALKTDYQGCISDSCEEYNVLTSVNEPDHQPSDEFKIYPNPTSSLLHIDCKKGFQYSIIIYNLQGNKVYSNHSDGTSIIIDVEDFSSGTYFVTLVSKNTSLVEKIIVIR